MKCFKCRKSLPKTPWYSFDSKEIYCPKCGAVTYAEFSVFRMIVAIVLSFLILALVSASLPDGIGALEIIPILFVGPISFYFAWRFKKGGGNEK